MIPFLRKKQALAPASAQLRVKSKAGDVMLAYTPGERCGLLKLLNALSLSVPATRPSARMRLRLADISQLDNPALLEAHEGEALVLDMSTEAMQMQPDDGY